jgi:hypothetical protein
MSQPITLFSGYSQRENRTTNYCLLVLRMLYEENPKFLAQVLSALVSEEVGERIGVKFRQQERKAASTPYGLILQPPSPCTLRQRTSTGSTTISWPIILPP